MGCGCVYGGAVGYDAVGEEALSVLDCGGRSFCYMESGL